MDKYSQIAALLREITGTRKPCFAFWLMEVVSVDGDTCSARIGDLVIPVFAIWLVEHFTLNRILKLFSYAQVLLDLAIVGIIVLRPGIAFQSGDTYSHALRGVYEAKNALASELAFGLIVMFLHIVSEAEEEKNLSPFWLAAIAFQGILLLMAKATGALLISM